MMDLTLTRRGSFTVSAADTDRHQCGIRGTRKFFYRVQITCPPEAKDEQGFLIDQLEVHSWLTQRYQRIHNFPSCELLAEEILYAMTEVVKDATKVKVDVGSSSVAFITAKWSR